MKKIGTCITCLRSGQLVRSSGRTSSMLAPVVPIRFASNAPTARKAVLTSGVARRSPRNTIPPEVTNKAPRRTMNETYSRAVCHTTFASKVMRYRSTGTPSTALNNALFRLLSQKCGQRSGMTAMPSSMSTNGKTDAAGKRWPRSAAASVLTMARRTETRRAGQRLDRRRSVVALHEPADRHACQARGESDDRTPEHVKQAKNVGPFIEQPQRFIAIRGKRRVASEDPDHQEEPPVRRIRALRKERREETDGEATAHVDDERAVRKCRAQAIRRPSSHPVARIGAEKGADTDVEPRHWFVPRFVALRSRITQRPREEPASAPCARRCCRTSAATSQEAVLRMPARVA